MESLLVATKLRVPAPRSGLIGRARLIERLERGAGSRLVLVSAPAGFGKTSLLTQWLEAVADHGRVVAWLALDESDNRPGSFWPHLVAAIGAAVPGFGAGVLPLLESGGSPTEGMLASLVNELDALSDELWLVLDDYHLIDDQGIHAGVSYLLEHLPAEAHLLITTRADPPLPLARLRARGDLVEIRAADLRFTPEEASRYLNDVMGLELRPEDIVVLEARTEGWIAALQLAALSMQAALVESALPQLRQTRQELQLRAWVEPLPDEVVRRRPVLSVGFAGALLASGELAGVEDRLDDAERRMHASQRSTAGDAGELRRVPGHIAMFRAGLAQVRGDVPATVEQAQRALELALDDDHVVRAGAAGFLGIAFWTGGELGAAHRAWSECVARLERAGHVSDALGATLALGDICMVRGRLSDALAGRLRARPRGCAGAEQSARAGNGRHVRRDERGFP